MFSIVINHWNLHKSKKYFIFAANFPDEEGI
jgi:hypothetical protein